MLIAQKRKYIIVALVICGALVFSYPAHAKEKKGKPYLTLEPFAQAKGIYDDNVYQIGNSGTTDYIAQFKPGVTADFGLDKLLKLTASYNPKILFYTKNSDLNEFFHEFKFDVQLEFTKFKKWRNFRLGTEIDFNPVDVSAVNTGDTGINSSQRLMGALVPGYLWKITPRTSLDIEARIQRTMFLDEGSDNNVGELNLSLQRKLLRRIVLGINAQAIYQDFDDIGTTLIYGGDVSVDVEFYKRLNGHAALGYQLIDLPNGAGTKNSLTLAADLEYAFNKRTSADLTVSRFTAVDISGNDFETTSLSLGGLHRISHRSQLGLDVYFHYAEQNTIVNNFLLDDNLRGIGTKLRWKFTKHWEFSLGARRTWNRGTNSTDDFMQNRFSFEIKYNYPFQLYSVR